MLIRHVDHFAEAKVDDHRLALSLAGPLEQEVLGFQIAVFATSTATMTAHDASRKEKHAKAINVLKKSK